MFVHPLLILLASRAVQAQSASAIDLKLAARYFQDLQWASDQDGGKLWGKPLAGPILFVEMGSREAVANEADGEGLLKSQEGVWVGKLPPEMFPANTAINWAKKHWTMVVWNWLDSNYAERTRLLAHECFHRIQDDLGLPAALGVRNAHLNHFDGRLWLRFEWRALEAALNNSGEARDQAVRDALLFRAARRKLVAGAAEEENRMEMHEGLAEYSGLKLRGTYDHETRMYVAEEMRQRDADGAGSLPTSFYYTTGPAYGLLLDAYKVDWRRGLKPLDSLSEKLAAKLEFNTAGDILRQAQSRTRMYDGKTLTTQERSIERDRIKRLADIQKRFVDGPILRIHDTSLNFTYDPNDVFPVDELGNFYNHLSLSGEWGYVDATKGARLSADFQTAYLAVSPTGSAESGDGWTLRLKPGWKAVPGSRKCDWVIQQG